MKEHLTPEFVRREVEFFVNKVKCGLSPTSVNSTWSIHISGHSYNWKLETYSSYVYEEKDEGWKVFIQLIKIRGFQNFGYQSSESMGTAGPGCVERVLKEIYEQDLKSYWEQQAQSVIDF